MGTEPGVLSESNGQVFLVCSICVNLPDIMVVMLGEVSEGDSRVIIDS